MRADIEEWKMDSYKRFVELRGGISLPDDHVQFLLQLKGEGLTPSVIYDIGSSVLHWYDAAKALWPDSMIIPFEAMSEVKDLYRDAGVETFVCGFVLSDRTGDVTDFYQNLYHPGGNSVYRENSQYSPNADTLFPPLSAIEKVTVTLDDMVAGRQLPFPDLIKMDVQGAELDVLKGATNTIAHCNHVILELQHVDYNVGAPKRDQVILHMETLGFSLKCRFTGDENSVDGDYYFARV